MSANCYNATQPTITVGTSGYAVVPQTNAYYSQASLNTSVQDAGITTTQLTSMILSPTATVGTYSAVLLTLAGYINADTINQQGTTGVILINPLISGGFDQIDSLTAVYSIQNVQNYAAITGQNYQYFFSEVYTSASTSTSCLVIWFGIAPGVAIMFYTPVTLNTACSTPGPVSAPVDDCALNQGINSNGVCYQEDADYCPYA